MKMTRSHALGLTAGLGAYALPRAVRAAPSPLSGPPEQKSVRVGLAVQDISYLNLYIARAQDLWAKEGLDVQFVAFPGDAPVAQAIAGGSVDVNIASMAGLLNLVEAGQPVKTVYLLTNQAVFSFLGNAKVTKWSDLKGGTFGVASYGSLTAALASAALEQHGLVVNRDVQLVQTGGTPNAYAALLSGQLSGSTAQLLYALRAKAAGLHVLGTQQQVTGPVWPDEVVYAKEDYLRRNPRVISALLRGIALADRVIVTQPQTAIKTLADALKLEPEIAAASYQVVKSTYPPRGEFPKDLTAFWKVMVVSKTVPEPLPPSKWYDGTWIDNYGAWRPR